MSTGTGSSRVEFRACRECGTIQLSGTDCSSCGKGLTLVGAGFLEGSTVGKYRLDRVLGEGGMGVVFRASHVTLGKRVAVKLLLPRLHENYEGFAKRFLQEARVLAELHHPSIVEVYDFDLTPWQTPYYVMEHLRGMSLYELLSEHKGPIPETWTAVILGEIVSGLVYAHGRSVVHRDLKPDNVFITTYGGKAAVKILDFGIAKVLGEGTESTRLTMTGTVMGTPQYLAPEQVLDGKIGPWTDQYALALLTAEMMSGVAPRAGKTVGEILARDIREPLEIKELGLDRNPGRAEALTRASQPDPACRYESVSDFFEVLDFSSNAGDLAEIGNWVESKRKSDGDDPVNTPLISDFDMTPVDVTGPLHGPISPVDTPTIDMPSGAISSEIQKQPERESEKVTEVDEADSGGRRWISISLIMFSLAIITALVLIYALRKPNKIPKDGGRQTLETQKEFLKEKSVWQLPPDARSILGQNIPKVFVAGAGGVYILDETSGKSAKVPFSQGDELICGNGGAGTFLFRKTSLVYWSPSSGRSVDVADGFPAGKRDGFLNGAVNANWTRLILQRGSNVHLYSLDSRRAVSIYSYEDNFSPSALVPVDIGSRTAAFVVPGGDVFVLGLKEGNVLARFPLNEARPYCIAINESRHIVAVGGWFDRIRFFDYEKKIELYAITKDKGATAFAWLGDGWSLLAGGNAGLSVLRPGAGDDIKIPVVKAGKLQGLLWGDGEVLSLDSDARLHAYNLNSLPSAEITKLGNFEIWGMTAPSSRLVLAGDSSGKLFELKGTESGGYTVKEHALHNDGITSLTADELHCATSSDDKSIAVWKLPEIEVEYRSKAHSFLVNSLYLSGSDLWSASSDGSVKLWSWPDLAVRETVDLTKLLNRKAFTCQCVWASKDRNHLLVGTWEGMLIDLRREGTDWKVTKHPVYTGVLYQMVEIEEAGVVVITGFNPFGAYCYDLTDGSFHKLSDLGAKVHAVCSDGKGGAWCMGPGSILHYIFTREPSGALTYKVAGGLDSSMETALAGVVTTDGKRLVVGNNRGQVYVWETSELEKGLGPELEDSLFADGKKE